MSAERSSGKTELESLYAQHHAALWRLALRLSDDTAAAEDLLQETFVRALRRPRPRNLRSAEAWLARTLINLCRDGHRWSRVRRLHAASERRAAVGRAPATGSESRVVARLSIESALRRLPVKRRAVLVLHDLEGLDEGQIAALMGIRPSTVRWHLAVARKEMKRIIGEEQA